MQIRFLAAMLVLAGACLCYGKTGVAQEGTVTVCMEASQSVPMGVRPLASSIFRSIGVTIDWREMHACPQADAIQVRVSHDSTRAQGVSPEALAVARPYAGTIIIFADRVQEFSGRVRFLMAYVLVHEITHVVERIERHSSTGIMKAHWDNKDYFDMRRKVLVFAPEDVDLIYRVLRPSKPENDRGVQAMGVRAGSFGARSGQ